MFMPRLRWACVSVQSDLDPRLFKKICAASERAEQTVRIPNAIAFIMFDINQINITLHCCKTTYRHMLADYNIPRDP